MARGEEIFDGGGGRGEKRKEVSLLQLSPFFPSIIPLSPQKRLILRLRYNSTGNACYAGYLSLNSVNFQYLDSVKSNEPINQCTLDCEKDSLSSEWVFQDLSRSFKALDSVCLAAPEFLSYAKQPDSPLFGF